MSDFVITDGTHIRIIKEDGISKAVAIDRDGVLLWKKGPPVDAAWSEIWKVHDVKERVQRGSYQYVNGVQGRQLFIVFTPFGGLDFNVIFDFQTGEVLGLSQAR